MSQVQRTKHPVDVLQSMINAILIETGRALRFSDKEGGRTLANANTRLRSTIPSAIENFHQALDELECDILRAKSVLLRDLEELRAKRFALENPVPIVEEVEPLPESEMNGESIMTDNAEPTTIKEEDAQASPEKQMSGEMSQAQPTQDLAKEDILKAAEDSKEQQGLTPPPSNDNNSKPIGLGIDTEGIANSPAPGTAELPNSSVDSLFDIPDNENNGDSELNFDNMDFSLHDSTQDPSQTQAHEFDLSTFGANTQDYMNDMQTDPNTVSNTNNASKDVDDLYGIGDAGESMELEMDLDMAGAEDSLFDEMFMSRGGEMEHGEFDNAFFGLEND